jgi:hypothetical protein
MLQCWAFMIQSIPRTCLCIKLFKTFLISQLKRSSKQSQKLALMSCPKPFEYPLRLQQPVSKANFDIFYMSPLALQVEVTNVCFPVSQVESRRFLRIVWSVPMSYLHLDNEYFLFLNHFSGLILSSVRSLGGPCGICDVQSGRRTTLFQKVPWFRLLSCHFTAPFVRHRQYIV